MNILGRGVPAFPAPLLNGIRQAKSLMSIARGNPQQILGQMAKSNPAIGQVMQLCAGKNPEEVARQMCEKAGIKYEDLISQLR